MLPTAMGLPLITLQPGGSRPPTNQQKTNILSILGASAIGHGHSIAEIVGLVEALGGKLGIAKSPTAPVDTELLWFNTTSDALAVFYAGSWRVFSGGGGGGIVTSETTPLVGAGGWFDPSDSSLAYWNGAVWVDVAGPAGSDYTMEVTNSAALSGTLTGLALTDETVCHRPNVTVASLVFRLPTPANSRPGQVKTFFAGSNITSFTLDANGNTVVGNELLSAQANESYSWHCVDDATWIRLA